MPNPAAWFGQGEPNVQAVTTFVDPTTGATNIVNTTQGLPVGTGVPMIVSLTAGTSATGPGTALNGFVPHSTHTLIVLTSTGVSAGVVQLQGSLDNVNWINMPGVVPNSAGSSVTTNAAATVFAAYVTGVPFQYVRANITTVITGGTVTAWVASA